MHSVGEKLRTERQRQNRTISAIASETCINARYLEAIEMDDLASLPGGFFYKSFVKQYSSALGLAFETVESDVDRLKLPEVDDPLPALSTSYHVAKTEGRTSMFFENRASWATGFLILALAGGGGFYRWWQKHQRSPGDSAVEVRPAPQGALPKVEAAPVLAENAVGPSIPAQKPAAPPVFLPQSPVAAPVPQETPKLESAKLSVGLSAKERTWVSLSSDGKTVFSGVLDASETKSIEGMQNAKLLTGNAAGLEVSWNGKSIGPLGTHGQARLVVFTRVNFRILSPGKM